MNLVCPDCHQELEEQLHCAACGEEFEIRSGVSNFLAEPPADFTAERYRHMVELESEHFWFQGRRELLLRLLQKYVDVSSAFIAELGCGSGWLFRHLGRIKGAAVDGHFDGLIELQAMYGDKLTLARCDVTRTALPSDNYDLVCAFDVMEHVDERAFLSEADRLLKSQGRIILSVPACPWLWSQLDEAAGHRKRYVSQDLRHALVESGFRVLYMTHYQCLLFPLFVFSRLAGLHKKERKIPRGVVNLILKMINRLDGLLASYVPLPWGSSLIVVGEKCS